MQQWVIYKHTSIKSGKSYIGLTSSTLRKRWVKHVSAASKGSNLHFHRAIRLYGVDNWKHEEIASNIDTLDEANALEKYYIKLYDTFENGYNLTFGGDCSFASTPEGSKKLSDRMKKQHGSRLYSFYNPKLKILEEDIHMCDFCRKYSLNDRQVSGMVHGKHKFTKGWFLWEGVDKKYEESTTYLFEHTEHGVEVASIKEMCKKYKLTVSNLHKVTTGERNSHKGWRLINEKGVQR